MQPRSQWRRRVLHIHRANGSGGNAGLMALQESEEGNGRAWWCFFLGIYEGLRHEAAEAGRRDSTHAFPPSSRGCAKADICAGLKLCTCMRILNLLSGWVSGVDAGCAKFV